MVTNVKHRKPNRASDEARRRRQSPRGDPVYSGNAPAASQSSAAQCPDLALSLCLRELVHPQPFEDDLFPSIEFLGHEGGPVKLLRTFSTRQGRMPPRQAVGM